MKKSKDNILDIHPVEARNKEIEEHGVYVIEDVTTLPSHDAPYVSPHMVIVICHQGYARGEYDMKPIEFRAHDLSLIYPNHPILDVETSDDYRSTLIILSSSFYEELRPRFSYGNGRFFHNQPCFHLTEMQYQCLCDTVRLLKSVCSFDIPSQKDTISSIIDVISKLIYHFRENDATNTNPQATNTNSNDLLFHRFYELLAMHYKESREVSYYARLLCLSPKYFGSLIKKEMGRSASQCIAHYVALQAKSMLCYRNDLSIQQIGYQLGFDDQTSFSRYFKATTGLSPKEYRMERQRVHEA